jgi:hypothetical protein
MGALIRQARESDSQQWLELLRSVVGDEYPDKQVYTLPWISAELSSSTGSTTWVAECNGLLHASITLLPPLPENSNPICNLGRHLVRTEAYADGSADELLRKVTEVASETGQVLVSRVLASNNPQQLLYERCGFACAGFQPLKHLNRVREGALYYVRAARTDLVNRLPVSESLPQIVELAAAALANLKLPQSGSVRDGAIGYPLQSDVKFHEASFDDFELWRMQSASANPPVEISGAFNLGLGFLRSPFEGPLRAILAQRDEKITAGLAYYLDPLDRCVRLVNSFAQDDLSMGVLVRRALTIAQEQLSAVYVEVDIIMLAPRLLKTAEQLGFVPIAYLPAFYFSQDGYADVVKMVKLNTVYSPESSELTTQARTITDFIDHSFQDQKLGIAIINMLRTLPIFEGLGDGELRKMARLFTQKLYRPGDRIFNRGDLGNEAYVVMRGQIDILLDEKSKPLATIGNGQIFGELAFLDGAARVAMAVASQASILLVIQRSAFNTLVQREPHLGMVVMRNVAMELSNRLRKANAAISTPR